MIFVKKSKEEKYPDQVKVHYDGWPEEYQVWLDDSRYVGKNIIFTFFIS